MKIDHLQKNSLKAETNIQIATKVLNTEAKAIYGLINKLDDNFNKACNLLKNCQGHLIVTGMGKSGHIGKKLAATFASTGTPSFFMHPSEALHGDLGMIRENDILLAISNSGTNPEILNIIEHCNHLKITTISMCGSSKSQLALKSDIFLDIGVDAEACPLGLAPTASTTATLALGDALAVCVLEAKNFTKDDFARSHPSGKLGKRLLTRVSDIMHSDTQIPKVTLNSSLNTAILEMSSKRLGFTTIVAEEDSRVIVGVFTDGDLRRVITDNLNPATVKINAVMTKKPKTINKDALAADAATILGKYKITAMPVTDKEGKLVGAFNIHNLIQAGII